MELIQEYEALRAKDLKLDMFRGKPGLDQMDSENQYEPLRHKAFRESRSFVRLVQKA